MRLVLWLGLGLILGASGLGLPAPPWFLTLAHLASGVFLFIAGWELEFLELKSRRRFFALVFAGSFFVPFLVGYAVFQNLFLAAALSISALPVAVQILKEKGLYGTPFSREAITLASLVAIGLSTSILAIPLVPKAK